MHANQMPPNDMPRVQNPYNYGIVFTYTRNGLMFDIQIAFLVSV